MNKELIGVNKKEELEYLSAWKKIWKKEKRIPLSISLISNEGKILDIGSRWGDVTNEIYKKNKNVIGLDFVPKFVDMAKKKYPFINFKEGDVYKIPLNNKSFNTVFMGETLEHLANQEKAIKEIHRVLKPHGELVLSTPNIASLRCRIKLLLGKVIDDDKGHINLLTKKQLINLLERNGFKIVFLKGDNIRLSHLKLPCFYQNFADIFIVKAVKKNGK